MQVITSPGTLAGWRWGGQVQQTPSGPSTQKVLGMRTRRNPHPWDLGDVKDLVDIVKLLAESPKHLSWPLHAS